MYRSKVAQHFGIGRVVERGDVTDVVDLIGTSMAAPVAHALMVGHHRPANVGWYSTSVGLPCHCRPPPTPTKNDPGTPNRWDQSAQTSGSLSTLLSTLAAPLGIGPAHGATLRARDRLVALIGDDVVRLGDLVIGGPLHVLGEDRHR